MGDCRGRIWSLAVAGTIATLALLLISSWAGVSVPRSSPTDLQPAFSSSFMIDQNGSMSANGVFTRDGNTYTLEADYAGAIMDQRNGSVLLGAGFTLTAQSGYTAGLFALDATNVTFSGFKVTGPNTGVAAWDSYGVNITGNNFTTTDVAIDIEQSEDVTAFDNTGNTTGPCDVSYGSDITFRDNNITSDTGIALSGFYVSGFDVLGNNFSHSAGSGLSLQEVSDFQVTGNRLSSGSAPIGIDLTSDSLGTLTENDLTFTPNPIEAVDSSHLTLEGNFLTFDGTGPLEFDDSADISIVDTNWEGNSPSVSLDGTSNVTILNDDLSEGGVWAEQSSNLLIQNSDLSSGADGVLANNVTNLTIVDSNLSQGNNGLYAQASSDIRVLDSNLTRANNPLNLSDGTSNVLVDDSELNRGQFGGAYLVNVSNVAITHSWIQGSAYYGILAVNSEGLTVTATDFAGTSTTPGALPVELVDDQSSVFSNDSFQYASQPFMDTGSEGLEVVDSNLSNSSANGMTLDNDVGIALSGDNFFNDTGSGVVAEGATNLTVRLSNFGEVHNDGVVANLGTTDVVLTDNSFDLVGNNGVFATEFADLEVSGNQFVNAGEAFFLDAGEDLAVVNNTALNNSNDGLVATQISDVTIVGNRFSDDAPGSQAISLTEIDGLDVTGNTFANDDTAFLDVGPSEQELLVANEFVNNTQSFFLEGPLDLLAYHNDFIAEGGWQIQDQPTDTWDEPLPVGGNYWSNYTGTGTDGIGSTPFVLDASDVDEYPLLTPWSDHAAVFTETGLPIGTSWSVKFNGTTYTSRSNAITIASTVGVETAYSYNIPTDQNYSATPAHGSGTLDDGLVSIAVSFAVPTFALTFSESGLPSGASWTATVDQVGHPSTDPSWALNVANDTYSFSIAPIAGFVATPAHGDVTIDGAPQTVAITFTAFTYGVTLTESGLPTGTTWGIVWGENTVVPHGGNTTTGQSSSVELTLPNASYAFDVLSVNGYTPTPTTGTWTVAGGTAAVYIDFSANSTTTSVPPVIPATSPGLLPYYAVIGVVAVIALIGWVLAVRRRRSGSGGPPSGALVPPPPGVQ